MVKGYFDPNILARVGNQYLHQLCYLDKNMHTSVSISTRTEPNILSAFRQGKITFTYCCSAACFSSAFETS